MQFLFSVLQGVGSDMTSAHYHKQSHSPRSKPRVLMGAQRPSPSRGQQATQNFKRSGFKARDSELSVKKWSESARVPGDLLGRRNSRSKSPEAGEGWFGGRQIECQHISASCRAATKKGVSVFRGDGGNRPRWVTKGLWTK